MSFFSAIFVIFFVASCYCQIQYSPCFTVDYTTPVQPEAQAAVGYVTMLLADALVLNPSIPVRVEFNFSKLIDVQAPFQLGYAKPASFVAGYFGNVNTPVALANQKTASYVFPDTCDITAYFNNDSSIINWYFGTDGNPGPNQYDFVTVVLHEFIHGLGFLGLYSESVLGSITNYNHPSSYSSSFDINLVNNAGVNISSLFGEDPLGLFQALTQTTIYFDTNSSDAGLVTLYTPSAYLQGSSLYHLDENTYGDTQDGLMKPIRTLGQANHAIGLPTLRILQKIGYNVSIVSEETTIVSSATTTTGASSSIAISSETIATTTTLGSQFTFSTIANNPVTTSATATPAASSVRTTQSPTSSEKSLYVALLISVVLLI